MNAKRIGAVTLALAAALILGTQWHRLLAQSAEKVTERQATARTGHEDQAPTGLKKGAKIWLSANKIPFNPAKYSEGFIVEEVQGSWVRMKGESFEGAPWKEKEVSAWINFRTVDWYKVKE